jgi:hypothetical protein
MSAIAEDESIQKLIDDFDMHQWKSTQTDDSFLNDDFLDIPKIEIHPIEISSKETPLSEWYEDISHKLNQ